MKRYAHSFLFITTSLTAFLAASAAQAQAPAQAAAADEPVAEIVVTGSRIVRDGYEAPTPVSVLGASELQALSVGNVADAIARLPALSGNIRGQASSGNVSYGTAGVNSANLRNFGPSRTLVLLDGKRLPPTTLGGNILDGGTPDLNIIPNALISRIDVVTGGASAVYGSDAVVGVVNFILDRTYTGVKGSVMGGITTYGDGENYRVDVTAGTPFARDRGHFLISAEHAYNTPINKYSSRPWARENAYGFLTNPAYGTGAGQTRTVPQYITVDQVGLNNMMPGGLITTGPLKGTMFLEGGTPATFNYGNFISGMYMSGGDWRISRKDNDSPLSVELEREVLYSRVSYDLTDTIKVFGELHWARSQQDSEGLYVWRLGNVSVKADNAFIPDSLRTRMTALGVTSFGMGTSNADLEATGTHNIRTTRRYMVGAEGAFDAFDTGWDWEASYSHGDTGVSARSTNNVWNSRFNEAVDAVVDPATGRIVCRVSLTNPTNGCKPYNVMGTNVNAPLGSGTYSYFQKDGYQYTTMAQSVFSASITGAPFELWAGPVSVALNGEYRKETADTIVSAEDQAGVFWIGNYKPTTGAYSVTEGAVEVVVPLAVDEVWARSLEMNAAARATNYSVAGYVTTWKVGATYSPIDEITIRATRSRDIRAPNIGDLFSGGRPSSGAINDIFRNNESYSINTAVVGNPALVPERSTTTGIGVVFKPQSLLPGFGASIDYYNIKINGALATLGSKQVVDECFAGNQELCSYVTRAAPGPGEQFGMITFITNRARNLLAQQGRGIDFEASYTTFLSDWVADWEGSLTLRGMASKVITLNSTDVNGVVQEGAGVNARVGTSPQLSAPDFQYTLSATYTAERFSGTFTMRGMNSGMYNAAAIVCSTACPVSTANAPTVNLNSIAGIVHYGVSASYKVVDTAEIFMSVDNLLNTPPQLRYSPSVYYQNEMGAGNTAGPTFDREGRAFRVGMRFNM